MPATGRYWRHKSGNARIAEEEISLTRLQERCDVMANRSDREQRQPTRCPRHHSLHNRMGPCSQTASGPAVPIDCINRLHPTNATAPIYLLQCGSHPQRTSRTDVQCHKPDNSFDQFGFTSGFATSRAASMNSCATELSRRFFNLIIPISTRAPGVGDVQRQLRHP